MNKTKAAYILLNLCPALFWVLYLIPVHSGENWYKVIAWIVFVPLSLISAGPSLFFAAVSKRDGGWWLTGLFDLSPVGWMIAGQTYHLF